MANLSIVLPLWEALSDQLLQMPQCWLSESSVRKSHQRHKPVVACCPKAPGDADHTICPTCINLWQPYMRLRHDVPYLCPSSENRRLLRRAVCIQGWQLKAASVAPWVCQMHMLVCQSLSQCQTQDFKVANRTAPPEINNLYCQSCVALLTTTVA